MKRNYFKKVLVLIATYNGEEWIREQLSSINLQKDVYLDILLSDDNSKDNTLKEIQLFCNSCSTNVRILKNKFKFAINNGAAANFFNLISGAENLHEYNYVALSDQDDIWEKNHLIRAINLLEKKDADGYSSSDFLLIGKNKLIKRDISGFISNLNHFFESAGSGHTYVLTKNSFLELQRFINKNSEKISNLYFHDWFIFAFYRSRNYKWVIDQFPSVYYRHHQNNVIGSVRSFEGIKYRLKRLINGWYRNEIILIYKILNVDHPTLERLKRFKLMDRFYLAFILWRHRRRLVDKIFISIFPLISK